MRRKARRIREREREEEESREDLLKIMSKLLPYPFPGEVVHTTAQHEGQGVAARLNVKNRVVGQRIDATGGENRARGRHHPGGA